MHRGIHEAGVIDLAGYISWAKEPVDSQGIYRSSLIIVDVKEFHDPGQIVWFTRRFADKVYLV